MTLFQSGDFVLHSGQRSIWKIDCDALTNADWDTLGYMALDAIAPKRFGMVESVPRGGNKFAKALGRAARAGESLTVLVDDVLTTGESMERARAGREDVIGVVVFARGPVPDWVTPLFVVGSEWADASAAFVAASDAMDRLSGQLFDSEAQAARLRATFQGAVELGDHGHRMEAIASLEYIVRESKWPADLQEAVKALDYDARPHTCSANSGCPVVKARVVLERYGLLPKVGA